MERAFMRYHADASSRAFVSAAVNTCTCSSTPWKHLSERSLPAGRLATDPSERSLDPRQGREVLAQPEPYQKWHSYASLSWETVQRGATVLFDLRTTTYEHSYVASADLRLYYFGISVCSIAYRNRFASLFSRTEQDIHGGEVLHWERDLFPRSYRRFQRSLSNVVID